MQPYNVNFFDRSMTYVHHDSVANILIDDDYVSAVANSIEISPTDLVKTGQFLHITRDDMSFFGVVTDAVPGEEKTTVTYKPFITIFDEDFLFDTSTQGTSPNKEHPTLEATIKRYLEELYVHNSDTKQRLPISVLIDDNITQTVNWSLNVTPETEGSHYCIMGLYTSLIVNACKKYGVTIIAEPSFRGKTIYLTITKSSAVFNIDGDLNNVKVVALKYNDRPNGTNKLVVYNTENYSQFVSFYVHTDRSWDTDGENNRIVPVIRETRSAAPDTEFEDPTQGFLASALDIAYSTLSGLDWDNYIELETMTRDPIITPMDLKIGQKISLRYKDGVYTSILTGRKLRTDGVSLLLGSDRIQYSKRIKRSGGK